MLRPDGLFNHSIELDHSVNIVPLVVGGRTQDIIVAGRPLSEVVVAVRVRRLILVAQRKHLARGYVVTI